MIRVASFDVFDTLMTRLVGHPTSVFLLLGRRLNQQEFISCTPEAFARARVSAEHRAYSNHDTWVTLQDVYAELAAAMGLDAARGEACLEEELRLERALLIGVSEARAQVEAARARGERVVFVSDMYLSSPFIREQLERLGVWREGDACYVSCEQGHAKGNGLYRKVVAQEAVQPRQMRHSGNNMRDDVQAARRAGVTAEPFEACTLNRFEQVLESHAFATEGLSSVLAGASRAARISVPVDTAKARALRDTVAGVAAPTLTGFVIWVLQRAKELGLRRLYFVSRDGQVLLEMARVLAGKLGVDCELRYLHGSRQAWHLPALRQLGERELDWILVKTSFVSVRSALARVEVDPTEVRSALTAAGFNEAMWSKDLSDHELTALRRLLLEDRALQTLIATRAAGRREMLLRYLRQEGVAGPQAVALVDLGWYGRAQESLALASGVRLRGFYYGLHQGSLGEACGIRECYLFDGRRGVGHLKLVPDIPCILEGFCPADHGLVIGYREQDGRVAPVLKEPGNPEIVAWGLPLLQRTMRAFTEHLVLDPSLVNPSADVRSAITELLRTYWFKPSPTEVTAFGDFPFEDDQAGTYRRPFAYPYTWRDVLRAFTSGRIPSSTIWLWHEGCLVLTPRPVVFCFKAALRLGRIRQAAWRALKRRLGSRLDPPRNRGR